MLGLSCLHQILTTTLAVTDCSQLSFKFKGLKGRPVEVDFHGGDISSDGGSVLLAQADANLELLARVAQVIPDDRDPSRIEHSVLHMLRQRVFGIAHAYEDLNDHDTLRHDPLLRAVTGKANGPLASSPTLCRFENRADRHCAMAINRLLVETFIASHKAPPKEIIIDLDATDDPVHGKQEGRFFHGYYDKYCFLPLYAFCGEHLLCAWLRPSNIDASRGAWFLIAALTKRLRKVWPEVRIIVRADSGFCRWRMLRWCERHGVDYIIGLAKNSKLLDACQELRTAAEQEFSRTGDKSRRFDWIDYAAGTWDKARRVIVKAEHGQGGPNPRFVVTTLQSDAKQLYDEIYCARGEMENRIKEQQLGLFADRTSCQRWWPNQFRLLLSSLAYTLLAYIRRVGLPGTDLANAQVSTIRLKLLKIGAVVLTNTRRIKVHLTSACPWQAEFIHAVNMLQSSP